MELQENNTLFGITGVINRRNFIVNILIIITIIEVFFTTPVLYYLIMHPASLIDIITKGILSKKLMILLLFSRIAKNIMYVPSIIRRVRDVINKQYDKYTNFICICIFLLMLTSTISVYYNLPTAYIFTWLQLFIIIFLICAKGKTTFENPKNEVYKFNWGAFWGTWLWGLFNKSYSILWMIPILLTSGILPFMIVCGLKGNEWAYASKTSDDINKFHKGQAKQTVMLCFITPILVFVYFILFVFGLGLFINSYSSRHPQYIPQLKQLVQIQQIHAAKINFSKIEINNDSYKFYIQPKIWLKSSNAQKKSLFIFADSYVYNELKGDYIEFSGIHPEIMQKVKIYSSFNNELLGEYFVDEELINNLKSNDIKYNIPETNKQLLNGFKFNYHPSLP